MGRGEGLNIDVENEWDREELHIEPGFF